jgi:hypothetical protein
VLNLNLFWVESLSLAKHEFIVQLEERKTFQFDLMWETKPSLICAHKQIVMEGTENFVGRGAFQI